ncbi:MAG TPA: ornithine cyclodeaminase family protein [Chloroflexota bacterium]|jgi:ornithine cyclodeaminase/alanine dehydrogenase
MLLLDRATLAELLDVGDVIAAVEGAFAAHARGETLMPPKVYLPLPQHGGDLRAMPAYVRGAAGVKWVNSHPRNPAEHGLPTVMGIVILSDPRTGEPLALMDGGIVTSLRTGAAAAVATRHLARSDARTLGQIGCGAQALHLVRSVAAVRRLDEIVLYDRDPARAEALVARLAPLSARVGRLEEAAAGDVVTTATPGLGPVVRAEMVRPGAHLNAMGADGPGKQELDIALLGRARVIVDDLEQARHGGEINVALAGGQFGEEEIAATLGDVIVGHTVGRERADQITLFDSTGLAIQDVATAQLAYDRARGLGVGQEIRLS